MKPVSKSREEDICESCVSHWILVKFAFIFYYITQEGSTTIQQEMSRDATLSIVRVSATTEAERSVDRRFVFSSLSKDAGSLVFSNQWEDVAAPSAEYQRRSSSSSSGCPVGVSPDEECVLLFRGHVMRREGSETAAATDVMRLFANGLFASGMARVGVCVEAVRTDAAAEAAWRTGSIWRRQPFLFTTSDVSVLEMGNMPLVPALYELQRQLLACCPRGAAGRDGAVTRLFQDSLFIVAAAAANIVNAVIGFAASNWSLLAPVQSTIECLTIILLLAHLLGVCSRSILRSLVSYSDIWFLLMCTTIGIVGVIAPNPTNGLVVTFAVRSLLSTFCASTLDAATGIDRRVRGALLLVSAAYNAFTVVYAMYFESNLARLDFISKTSDDVISDSVLIFSKRKRKGIKSKKLRLKGHVDAGNKCADYHGCIHCVNHHGRGI